MKRSIQVTTIIGALIICVLVVGVAFRIINGAADSTDKAADKVSEFYLKELADRRTHIISSQIDVMVDQMGRAMRVISEEDLKSEDTLRDFIGKIETLYALDLFALVNEEDVVYSRYSTYMGGSRYSFLSQDLTDTGPVISTVHLYGGAKHICIAIPVTGVTFQGKDLNVCFVEIDIESFAEKLAFDAENAETWFGLYYRNGDSLTRMKFGPFDAGQNLLQASERMLDEKQWNTLNEDFQNGSQGEAIFRFQSDRDTMFYMPVPDTGWMMTVLISGNLVQDQVRGISEELLRRGTRYSVMIGVALILFFLILLLQMNKRSSHLLEQEKENTRELSERAEKSENELGVYKVIAHKDALTGVQSKYAYLEKAKEVEKQMQDGTAGEFAILVGDLNGLKRINDTFGHSAGDQYLKKGAMMLCKTFQHSPVYRIGGDEFVVLLQNMDYEHRKELIDELNRQVEENVGSDDVVISIGMSESMPDDRDTMDTFGRADHLMYDRKQQLKEMDAKKREQRGKS